VSRAGPVELRPTDSDLLIARAAARMATPERQRALRLATCSRTKRPSWPSLRPFGWLRAIHGAAKIVKTQIGWFAVSWSQVPCRTCSSIWSGEDVLIIRSGTRTELRAQEMFGTHSLRAMRFIPSDIRLVPRSLRPFVWPAVLSLAATRILVLAHYPSDVIAGLRIGVAIDKAIAAALRAWR